MENERIRCRKCRHVLLTKTKLNVVDAHGEDYHDSVGRDSESQCTSLNEDSCLYVPEESFPEFILQAVEESCWTKGKLYCPSCQARLGSFNFVCGSQCGCGAFVLPQVHILRSKVDWMKDGEALPNPVSFPKHSVSLCPSALPLDQPEQVPPSEAVVPDAPTHLMDPSLTPDTTSPTHSCRTPKRGDPKLHGKSYNKSKSRKQIRKKVPSPAGAWSDELSEGVIAKPSCFEVLGDEVSETEDISSPEEEDEEDIPDRFVCPVCLDVLYSPLVTKPCGHVFCEPCLRHMAQPTPTSTRCPLCRQTIGQCMPCPELSHDIQDSFYEAYLRRRQFERQHNSQHLPLPWIKNFRMRGTYNTQGNWVERAGGWRAVMTVMSLNILGIAIMLYLGREAKMQSNLRMT